MRAGPAVCLGAARGPASVSGSQGISSPGRAAAPRSPPPHGGVKRVHSCGSAESRVLLFVFNMPHGARDQVSPDPIQAQDPGLAAHTHSSHTTHSCAQSTPHTACVHKAPHTIHTHLQLILGPLPRSLPTLRIKCLGDKITLRFQGPEPPRAGEMCFHPPSDSC